MLPALRKPALGKTRTRKTPTWKILPRQQALPGGAVSGRCSPLYSSSLLAHRLYSSSLLAHRPTLSGTCALARLRPQMPKWCKSPCPTSHRFARPGPLWSPAPWKPRRAPRATTSWAAAALRRSPPRPRTRVAHAECGLWRFCASNSSGRFTARCFCAG